MTATPPMAPLTRNRRRARAVAIVALVAIPVLSAAADDDDTTTTATTTTAADTTSTAPTTTVADTTSTAPTTTTTTADTTTTTTADTTTTATADTTTTTADTTTTAADTTTTAADTTTTTAAPAAPAAPSFAALVARPGAPANLRGRRTGDAVALAWNAVPGATTYLVYVASSGAGPFTVAGTRSTPAFTVGNLDVGTRYYFRVSAGNAGGWSPVSTTLSVAGVVRPATPVDLRARRTDDAVALAWDAVPGATTYLVFVASSGAGPFTVAGTRSTPGFTVGNLDVGTRYYFRVSSGNAAGWSPVSTTLVVPAVVRPAAPTGLRVRRWSDNISLAWDAVPGANSYVIFMATSPAGPYTRLNVWPRASYTAGGVNPASRYYFRVFAGNAAGWSPMSATLVVPPVPIDNGAVPARNPGAMPVGVIGDSVLAALNDLGPSWGNLSAHYDVIANTRVCRRLIDVTCDGRGDPSALSILRGGTIRGDVLIVGVTNSEWAPAFGSGVDQVMAQARALGFERVVWLTTGRPGTNSAQVNSILRQKASANPAMRIADWVAFSSGHPDWFWADGVHLRTATGKVAMANFLAAHV